MKSFARLIVVVLLHKCAVFSAPQISSVSSFVVSSTDPSKESRSEKETTTDVEPTSLNVYEMNIRTNVSNRFATTMVTSKVKNWAPSAQQSTFSVILPEKAYISGFVMEIDGKSYKAYVKGKEEARQIYDQAVGSGQSAAHVATSARDSNRFTVSVNVEPQSKAIFKLTYDELLQRQNGLYEVVLNIHPGQLVKVLDVEVHINESYPLKFVKTPSLRTGNEIDKNKDILDPSADINIENQTAVVKFNPDEQMQRKFATGLGTKEDEGLAGQFIVQYEVVRDATGGQVLIRDGFFVHFFAPSELKPLPKYVVFVLDTSSSMLGTRIQQLKDAMNSILAELKADDVFNIIEFSSVTKVWNIATAQAYTSNPTFQNEQALPQAFDANEENVLKAKKVVETLYASGFTDIQTALEVALRLIEKTKRERNIAHQPIVMFLTDGEPTDGELNTDRIVSKITELNAGINRSLIFSLSFGDGADRNFLEKLSLKNLGFARHIYEAADASLQLQQFYSEISSPLLSDISFKYTSEALKLTKTKFPVFFCGSEIIVCGALQTHPENNFGIPMIMGRGYTGQVELAPKVEQSEESLEKLWAYLTVKQLLEQRDAEENKNFITSKVLSIALKYSFVTPVSSLVVVKPNDTKAVDIEDASNARRVTEPSYIAGWGNSDPSPSYGSAVDYSGTSFGAVDSDNPTDYQISPHDSYDGLGSTWTNQGALNSYNPTDYQISSHDSYDGFGSTRTNQGALNSYNPADYQISSHDSYDGFGSTRTNYGAVDSDNPIDYQIGPHDPYDGLDSTGTRYNAVDSDNPIDNQRSSHDSYDGFGTTGTTYGRVDSDNPTDYRISSHDSYDGHRSAGTSYDAVDLDNSTDNEISSHDSYDGFGTIGITYGAVDLDNPADYQISSHDSYDGHSSTGTSYDAVDLDNSTDNQISSHDSYDGFGSTDQAITTTTTDKVPTRTVAYRSTPENGTLPERYAVIKSQLPWLRNILSNDGTLTLFTGFYKLGLNETVSFHPSCPESPGFKGIAGACQLIPDCPQVFTLLADVQEFSKFFCSLDEYAGVCCPLA